MKYLFLISTLLLTSCHSSSKNRNINAPDKADTVKTYFPNGNTESITIYKNGKENGPYYGFYKDGNIRKKAYYKNGHLVDSSIFYHPNGKLGHIFYYDSLGDITGLSKIWYNNGNLRQLIVPEEGGIENGKSYYKSGQLRKSYSHKDNKKYGTWKYYTEDKEVYKEETYRNDSLMKDSSERVTIHNGDTVLQTGWVREYYHFGPRTSIKKETHYDNGVKHGYSVEYFESEDIKVISHYKDGLLSGKQFEYYNENNLKLMSDYKNGKKSGQWIYYDKEGNILKREKYRNDKLISN